MINLVNRQAEQGINRLTQMLRRLSGAESEAAQRFFHFSQNMTMAANTARDAFDVLKQGAVGLELKDSFREQVTQAGQSLDVFMGKLKEASGGTINNFNLMESAAKAMSLGVTSDADVMAEVLEIARFKARKFGRDTADAFEDIAIGIGRTSPLILDNLGILTGGEATFTAYAASIGKAKDQLTDVEKRQALLNKVLVEGRKELAAAGGMADTTADQYRKLTAELDNAKGAWSGIIAVAASAPVFGGQSFGGMLSGAAETLKQMQALETAFDGLQQSVQLTGGQEWALWIKLISGDIEAFRIQLQGIPGALHAWDASLAQATDKLMLTENAIGQVTGGMQALQEIARAETLSGFTQQIENIAVAEYGAYFGMAQDIQYLKSAIAEGNFDELQYFLEQYPAILGAVSQSFIDTAMAQGLNSQEAATLAAQFGDLINQEELLAAYNAELAEQNAQVAWSMIEGNNAGQEFALGLTEAADASVLASANAEELSTTLFQLAEQKGLTSQEALNLANELGLLQGASIEAQIAFVELAISEGNTAEEAIGLAQASGITTEVTQELATAAYAAELAMRVEAAAANDLAHEMAVATAQARLLADGMARISGAKGRLDAGFALKEAEENLASIRAKAPSGGSKATWAQYEAELWEAQEGVIRARERMEREATTTVNVGGSDVRITSADVKREQDKAIKDAEREAAKATKEHDRAVKSAASEQERAAKKAASEQERAAKKAASEQERAAKKATSEREKAAKEQERLLEQQKREQDRYNNDLERALKREQDILSQDDPHHALGRYQRELAELQANPPDTDDALAWARYRNEVLETEDAIAAAQKRIADEQAKLVAEQEKAAEKARKEQEKAAEEAQKAWEKTMDALQKEWDKAVGEVRGAVDGAIDLSIGVSEQDMMLAELGLYEDKVNEAGRRLEDVINRGADSPWVGSFGELIGLEGDTLKAGAIKLQQDIDKFLRPDLLNQDAILQNARESLIGDRNRQALVDDLTKQLVEEGWAEFDAQKALGESAGLEIPMPPITFAAGDQQRIAEEMGVAFMNVGQVAGDELINTLVTTMNNQMEAQKKEIESRGRRFAEFLVRGAEEGVQDNEIIGKLQEAITLNIMQLMAHVGMGMGGGG